jgi:ParB family chromosome partitioning protein
MAETMKRPKLAIAYRAIEGLHPAERNARTHSAEQIAQIAASVEQFGWTNPILVDEKSNVIAGHGRLEAAKLLGLLDVPTITLAGLTAAQKRALVIADNKLALNAGWDEAILAQELDALKALDFDLPVIGFSSDELDRLFPQPLNGMPGLPDGGKAPFQQMTFTLHDDQVIVVQAALEAAKDGSPFDGPNENSNGNALARVCAAYADS